MPVQNSDTALSIPPELRRHPPRSLKGLLPPLVAAFIAVAAMEVSGCIYVFTLAPKQPLFDIFALATAVLASTLHLPTALGAALGCLWSAVRKNTLVVVAFLIVVSSAISGGILAYWYVHSTPALPKQSAVLISASTWAAVALLTILSADAAKKKTPTDRKNLKHPSI